MDDQPSGALNGSTYKGSYIFSPIANAAGLPIDQFNFLFSEVLALVLAMCFRRFLPPNSGNTFKRHLVCKLFILYNNFDLNIFFLSDSSWNCSWSFLFWSTNLAFSRTIICRISNTLFCTCTNFTSNRICFLYGLYEC